VAAAQRQASRSRVREATCELGHLRPTPRREPRRLVLVALLLVAREAAAGDPCETLLAARGHLVAWQRAKAPSRATEAKARSAWASVPASCRGGMWYVTAANLLRAPGASPGPLVAGELRFGSSAEALAAGLAACPKDAALLATVAYLARVAPTEAPPLPAGACSSVDPGDAALRAYVCGSEAIAAGRWADADEHLGSVDPARVPDLAALRASIRKHTRRKQPATPAPKLSCDPFCPMEGWRR
jgi:hypothetical protein